MNLIYWLYWTHCNQITQLRHFITSSNSAINMTSSIASRNRQISKFSTSIKTKRLLIFGHRWWTTSHYSHDGNYIKDKHLQDEDLPICQNFVFLSSMSNQNSMGNFRKIISKCRTLDHQHFHSSQDRRILWSGNDLKKLEIVEMYRVWSWIPRNNWKFHQVVARMSKVGNCYSFG